jgi:hypothetical protein
MFYLFLIYFILKFCMYSNASKGKEAVEDGEKRKGKRKFIEQDESKDSDEEERPKVKCTI